MSKMAYKTNSQRRVWNEKESMKWKKQFASYAADKVPVSFKVLFCTEYGKITWY